MKHTIIILTFFLFAGLQSACQQNTASEKKADISKNPIPLSDSTDDVMDTSMADIGRIVRDEFPLKQKGWTNDFEGLFTSAQVLFLDSMISKFENETKVEIAIITLDTSWVNAENFDETVTWIGNIWGVGKKDLNNGIVIGISSALRKVRISTGTATEKRLTDEKCGRIIEEIMIPRFRNADIFGGTVGAVMAIIQYLK